MQRYELPNPLTLVIASDRRLGETLVDLLELLDQRCEYSADSKTAYQRMRELKPDLILLDLPYYGRTGLDLLTNLRIDLRLRDTKVIVLTTDQYAEIAELQLADAVLLKPFSFDLLEETVCRLTENHASSASSAFEAFSSIHS